MDEADLPKSEEQIQFENQVNRHPETVNRLILEALRALPSFPQGGRLTWLSPVDADFRRRLTGSEIITRMGWEEILNDFNDFWPTQFPLWDGVAVLEGEGEAQFVLVNVFDDEEGLHSGVKAPSSTDERIKWALDSVKVQFDVDPWNPWLSADRYPYASRLAQFCYLREFSKKPIWMIDMICTIESEKARAIYRTMQKLYGTLGLPEDGIPGRAWATLIDQPLPCNGRNCAILPVYRSCRPGRKLDPGELIQEPPRHLAPFTDPVVEERFSIGDIHLPVTTNIYHLPESLINHVYVSVKLENEGAEGIRTQMEFAILTAEAALKQEGVNDVEGAKPQGVFDQLRKIVAQFSPDTVEQAIEVLHQWDQHSAELRRFFSKYCCPPIVTLLRDSFFLPHRYTYEGKDYPAGCYVLDERKPGRTKDEASAVRAHCGHELAHAAIAVNRCDGAVEGCPWMEEAMADIILGWGLNESDRPEYEMHLGWKYLDSLTIREFDGLLARWLDPRFGMGSCDDVRKMRKYVQQMAGLFDADFLWVFPDVAEENARHQTGKSVALAQKRYLSQAHECPKCHTKPTDLAWFWFSDIAFLCGSAGWKTVCKKCQVEVDYFMEMIS